MSQWWSSIYPCFNKDTYNFSVFCKNVHLWYSPQAFTATEFNEMFPGWQLCQDVKAFWPFRDWLCPNLILITDKQALAKCNDLLDPPTNQRGHIPSCAQAQKSYRRHRVGHLVISFGSAKPPATPWRWGHNKSLKCQNTFTSWRSCLPENISLHSFMN